MNWFAIREWFAKFGEPKLQLLKRIVFFYSVLHFLCVGQTHAQLPRQYSFIHYSTSSGLLSNQVNTVVQDADGFIWTGTTDGLQRFDGVRYKTFRHDSYNPLSIPSNPVLQLLVDQKKNLWVLLADGRIGIFSTTKFTFREVVVKTKKAGAITTALKELIMDEFGQLFLLLRGIEVITYNEKNNEFSTDNNFIKQKAEWVIHGFIQQPGTQKYLMVIPGSSIAIYNDATKQLSYPGNNIEEEAFIDALKEKNLSPYHLYFDKKGRIWFIVWTRQGFPGVYCYDFNKKQFIVEMAHFIDVVNSYYELQGFYEQKDGTIWVRGAGVFAKFLEAEKKFELVYNGYVNERSIAYEMVTCLYEDHERNVWVGTANNGLYRFNPSGEYFKNVNHTNRVTHITGTGSPMSFIYTKWGTILAGTWGDGLYHYDKNFKQIPINIKGLSENGGPFVWGMFASRDSNTLWLSAQPGFYAVNQATRSATFYNPAVLENRTIRQIVEDRNGSLWLGMQHIGVFKYTAADKKNNRPESVSPFKAIPRMTINKIIVDSKGYIWIATPLEGIFVIDPDTDNVIMHFHHNAANEKKLPETGVSGVLEYDDSTMIITTATRIVKYNRKSNRSVLIGNAGILSGYIAGMEKDRKGYLWLTTTNGLYRIHINKKIFVSFNRMDGINNDHFTLSASLAMPDGRLIFGSTDHMIVFNPAAIEIASGFPEIKITDFKVMNKSLPIDSLLQLKPIELDYKDNSLVIEFSPLNFSKANLVKYKLEGLDKDWKFADKNNEAIYSYLPPDTYTFLLKTINEEGNESAAVTYLTIKINPPFWKSWWFYSILILIAAILLYWFDRERMKRKESMQRMRTDIADNLHKEVNTALNNINILSEMARLKAETDPQKSKEYIEQIHSRSHNMMIAMDDMLWSIDPENDHMQRTVERMKEYIDALKNRYGIDIELFVDKKVESLELNMKLRHEAFLLFKEAAKSLVNAGAQKCDIYIGLEKSKLLFTMQFSNEHCDMQQLNNLLQRQDMEKRLQSIHAVLDVQVHKSNSVFILQVPVE